MNKTKGTFTLPKSASHIPGFDEILFGGLPEGRTTLVEGGPGTGKSILALEFLYRGVLEGEPGILIAFEERAEAIRRNALTMGWDLEALERSGKFGIIDARMDPLVVVSGDFSIKALLAIVEGQSGRIGARRVVFDALSVLMRLYGNHDRERGEMHTLHEWLLDHAFTAVLTVNAPEGGRPPTNESLEYMADCVIKLVQRPGEWVSTRELQIIKYRGSDFGRNAYPFVIEPGGMSVIPISEFGLQHLPMGDRLSTGNESLDNVLGGGYRRGACILIAGSSGTGKTTLANTFVKTACARGEKVLFLGFEESAEAMMESMLSPGIDLRPAARAGLLKVVTAMPEAFGTEKHLVRTFHALDDMRPDHFVVDSVSAFVRMGSRRAAFEFAMRLVNRCKERGITALMTNQASGGGGDREQITGVGISSIVDTLLWLRFVDTGDGINRTLLVIKSRGSRHSTQYHDFRITDHGIKFAGETAGAVKEREAK